MDIIIPRSYWRFFVVLFFSIVFCFILYHARFLMSTPDAPDTWLVGDWLINYQGGFVRRGLMGEIFLALSQMSGIHLVTLVVLFQLIMYLIFFINTGRLSLVAPFSPSGFLLITSPAFILFPVLDYQGAFRKEIMLLALLSALCINLINSKTKTSNTMLICVGMALILIVLSHEMLVAYLPYILCAFIICDKGWNDNPGKVILSIVPAVIVAVSLMLFWRGSHTNVIAICDSLQPSLPLDCYQEGVPGSISLLDDTIASARDLVDKSTWNATFPIYVIVLILSLVPLILVWISKRSILLRMNKGKKYWLIIFLSFTLIASIPLFWVVSDYGRLIYIHISCLSLLTLMMVHDTDNMPLHITPKQVLAWAASVIFIVNWRLIHWGATFDKAFPLVGFLKKFFR